MKVKTSITLSEDVLRDVDQMAKDSSRSEVIEQVLRDYLVARARAARNARDRALYEKHFDEIDALCRDVLTFAAPIEFEEDDDRDA